MARAALAPAGELSAQQMQGTTRDSPAVRKRWLRCNAGTTAYARTETKRKSKREGSKHEGGGREGKSDAKTPLQRKENGARGRKECEEESPGREGRHGEPSEGRLGERRQARPVEVLEHGRAEIRELRLHHLARDVALVLGHLDGRGRLDELGVALAQRL